MAPFLTGMEYILKEKASKEELEKIFESVRKRKKGVNVKKYPGKVKASGYPVKLQRKLREE